MCAALPRSRTAVRRTPPALALAAVLASRGTARADMLPAGSKIVAYSYEVENVSEHPDYVLVAWPRRCDSGGDPLGTVRFVDPNAVHSHVVDYEVIESRRVRSASRYCARTMRFFALPASSFPRAEVVASEDDWQVDWKKGASYTHVPTIDALDWKQRVDFFGRDARVVRLAFQQDVVMLVASTSPLVAVHDVLAVERPDGGAIGLVATRSAYRYDDGKTETLPWSGAARPLPLRPGALAPPKDDLFGSSEPEPSPTQGSDDDSGAAGAQRARPGEETAPRAGVSSGKLVAAVMIVGLLGAGAAFFRRRRR